MADITTATVSSGLPRWWAGVPRPQYSQAPRGEMLFAGNEMVPAKLAADKSLWTLTCNFPRNFVYRIVEARIWALADDTASLVDWGNGFGLSCLVTSDLDDAWRFHMGRVVISTSAMPLTFGSVDPAFIDFYLPDQPVDAPIRTAAGNGSLLFQFADVSGDTTLETNMFFRVRSLIYDVDQDYAYPMHTPVPSVTP